MELIALTVAAAIVVGGALVLNRFLGRGRRTDEDCEESVREYDSVS